LEWSPNRYPVDMPNTFFADSHALPGLEAGQRIGKRWLWYVEGRNVTGRKYAAATGMARTPGGADGPQFLPGDGRSFYAGLQWQL
jgi:iron complex outermembrane receptor protein